MRSRTEAGAFSRRVGVDGGAPRHYRGEPGLELDVVWMVEELAFVTIAGSPEGRARLRITPELVEDAAGAEAGLQEVAAERRVTGPLLEELGVKAECRSEQFGPERAKARHGLQLALADFDEEIVDGLASLLEVGLGSP